MKYCRLKSGRGFAVTLLAFATLACAGCGLRVEPDGALADLGKAIWFLRPTFYVPDDTASRVVEVELPWCGRFVNERSLTLTSFKDLDDAVMPHFLPPPRRDRGVLAAEFLHVSDAQIRDETLYAAYEQQRALGVLDGLVPVTVRNGLVERNDCVTFAAFLASYAKGARWDRQHPPQFIVHTGDLLDLSVRSELLPALQLMRDVKTAYGANLFSVAGNHDGATFGNIPDSASDTRALGVNRTEFVIAHLLFDPKTKGGGKRQPTMKTTGFGFGNNEIVRRLIEEKRVLRPGDQDECGLRRHPRNCATEQLEDLLEGVEDVPDLDEPPSTATELRTVAKVTGLGDTYGRQLGYYVLGETLHDEAAGPNVRFLVLDTRMANFANGEIDLVQLGWLEQQLKEALARRQIVVLFAHHAAADVSHNGRAFRGLLQAYPNVGAYFYGHGHWNGESAEGVYPLAIQTGSLVDFPQAARDVRLYTRWAGNGSAVLDVWWRHWRPRGRKQTAGGRHLQGLLDQTLSDAKKEHNESLWFFQSPSLVQAFVPRGSTYERIDGSSKGWLRKHLKPGLRTATLRMTRTRTAHVDIALPRTVRRQIEDERRSIGLDVNDATRSKGGTPVLEEASAAALVGDELFVAGDETKDRLWRFDFEAGDIASAFDLETSLNDVEGLASWDDRHLFAITSFSLKKGLTHRPTCGGKDEPSECSRERLAFVDITAPREERVARTLGPAFIEHLQRWSARRHDAGLAGLATEDFFKRHPGDGGLNVEGIVRSGDGLLIGLREPTLRGGGAIVLQLRNPVDVVSNNARARFDDPIVLDADPGIGIRDLTPGGRCGGVLALLGPSDDVKPSRDGAEAWFQVKRWFPERGVADLLAISHLEICPRASTATAYCRQPVPLSPASGWLGDKRDQPPPPEALVVLPDGDLLVLRDAPRHQERDAVGRFEARGCSFGPTEPAMHSTTSAGD